MTRPRPDWPADTERPETVDDLVRDALVTGTRSLLDECTPPQQKFFTRLYPGNLMDLPEEKLRHAYELCRRTVIKNRNGRSAP